MAVGFSAVTIGSGQSATPTLAHNPQGAERALLVALLWIDPLGEAVFDGAQFGGAPLTELGAPQAAGGATLQVFRRAAPAAGSANVVVTFDMPVDYAMVVTSYTGTHQGSPTGVVAVASGSSAEPSVVCADTVADSMIFDAVGVMAISATMSGTPHGGQEARAGVNAGSNPLRIFLGASDDDGGGNGTMAWTTSHVRAWVHKAVEIKPAPLFSAYRRNWTGFWKKFGSPQFGGG